MSTINYERFFEAVEEVAERIATEALHKQQRFDRTLILDHSKRVRDALTVPTERIAGILHDVLEDSDWTREELIEEGIPISLADTVETLTRKPSQSYLQYLLMVKTDHVAVNVKIADMKDNLKGATGTLRSKYLLGLYILTGTDYSEESK